MTRDRRRDNAHRESRCVELEIGAGHERGADCLGGAVVETPGVGDVQMNQRITRRRSGRRGRHAARMRGRKAPSHLTELPYCQGAQPPAGIPACAENSDSDVSVMKSADQRM
jgi:hypothetical protein